MSPVKKTFVETGFYSLMTALFFLSILMVGPVFETRYFPVMRYPAVISTMLTETDFKTRIAGSSKRLRDCEFVRLEWLYGQRAGRAAGVTVEFLEKPKIRSTGEMEFGPWLVHVPIDQIHDTYATAVHRCTWFGYPAPWLTRSPFY